MDEAVTPIAFTFLPDEPEKADAFGGRGHERSARALAHAIESFSNDDRSIGLEGKWGSGKTTVVAIAAKNLEDRHPKEFAFFTFDLWASQSVDFRRAVLEEFLAWAKSYIPKNTYEDLEKRVQGKTKTVEKTTERQFSFFGYVLMSAIVIMPILLLWLSPFSANMHKSGAGASSQPPNGDLPWPLQFLQDYGHWAAVAVIALVVVSFLIQLGLFLHDKGSLRKAFDALFSLLSRKADDLSPYSSSRFW